MKKDKDVKHNLLDKKEHKAVDFTGQKIGGLDLQGKNFAGSSFESASLTNSNLAWCNFESCNLTKTNFRHANLSNANITGAFRNGAQILKHCSIVLEDKHHYAFLCITDKQVVYINEDGKDEIEYQMSTATGTGRTLYNLLING